MNSGVPGRWAIAFWIVGAQVLLCPTLVLAGPLHGHVIEQAHAPNHDSDFDFTRPSCEPALRPASGSEDVLVRYLGVSGLYIEWKNMGLMTAPFFSGVGLAGVAFGEVKSNSEAIRRGLEGLDLRRVRAVFSGHGHYDHLADLPAILLEGATEARVFVNQSSANMLWAYEPLRGRLEPMNDRLGRWIELRDDEERPLVRFMALASNHAPHVLGMQWADGQVGEAWKDWQGKRRREMKKGLPLAFLIDLLDPEDASVRFRIWFQDAVARPPGGIPSERDIERHAVDLAVLCMPSYWRVEGFPESILTETRARHVLVSHYEDFFRSPEKPLRFVSLLTNSRANRFLERIGNAIDASGQRPRGPRPCTCGPCSETFTMPLPGEWLRFTTARGGNLALRNALRARREAGRER